MLVSGRAFRDTTDAVRAARFMKAQLERGPVHIAGSSGGNAPGGDKGYALQQKGKDQHRGGKLPPGAP